jgi:hypothetical protein
MRDIFARHRADSRDASPAHKNPKRLWMRLPNLRQASRPAPRPKHRSFEFNGSLAKLGVQEKLAAEELIDQWTVQFLSHGKPDPHTFKSVEQAIEDYLAEKRGTLDPHKESTKLTIQKIAGILRPLAPFLSDRGIVHLKDASISRFFRRPGRAGCARTERVTANSVRQPKSQLGQIEEPGIRENVLPPRTGAALDPGESRRAVACGPDAEH